MSDDDRPTSLRVAEAAQRLLADDSSLVASLEGVAAAGCSLLEGCSAASITLLQLDRPMTIASTSEVANALDDAQYRQGDGPCLTAAREERLVQLDHIADQAPWPAFAAAAADRGIASSLSVPLLLNAPQLRGGLNLYADEEGSYDESDVAIAESFASQASTVVMNAIAYWREFDQAANLVRAMEHRAEIEQAKGILMATQRCTADEAFDMLRRASQRENRKLREVAAEIVANASRAAGL
jgi:GAF domain-containing protein